MTSPVGVSCEPVARAWSMRCRTSRSRLGSVAKIVRTCAWSPERSVWVWCGASGQGGSCCQSPQRAP